MGRRGRRTRTPRVRRKPVISKKKKKRVIGVRKGRKNKTRRVMKRIGGRRRVVNLKGLHHALKRL
jgi:hypothetical protein